ncbi:hypothetical protein Tco_1267100 [Tanacetum coccineum]
MLHLDFADIYSTFMRFLLLFEHFYDICWNRLFLNEFYSVSLERLMKSISQTCSKSDTQRWIAKRVSDSGTAGVEVANSVVVCVGIDVDC